MSLVYKTIQGDTWDIVAKKIYGSEMYADFLMKNNFELLDIAVFSANTIINAPEVEKKPKISKTAPWRR